MPKYRVMKNKKLILDKSTLSRLQTDQLNAVVGGMGCESGIITIDVDAKIEERATDPDSCCNKSCRRN